MATLIHPDLWNSAHRPIYYRVPYTGYKFSDVQNASGDASLNVGAGTVALTTVGQRVYVTSGIYMGDWVVVSGSGNYLRISAPYLGPATVPNQAVRLAVTVNAALYAGYQSPHEGYADHPYRKLADISHPADFGGEAKIDVSGFIRGMFTDVRPPKLGADFTMSVPFILYLTGDPIHYQFRYAINGTLPHSTLAGFDADYAVLNAQTPIHFTNGVTYYSMIWPDTSIYGEHVVNVMGVDGTGLSSVSLGIGFDTIGGTFTVG
jgi:hypothetical protein